MPTRRRTDGLPLLLVCAFASLPLLGTLQEPLFTLDEALLLVYPEQILLGDVPNRDFYTSYGPGGLGLLAAVFTFTGPSVLVERIVGLAYHVAIASGVFALSRPVGRSVAGAAGVLSALLLVPLGSGAYVWLGAVALTIWSLAVLQLDPESTWRARLAGGLALLAMAWRPEIGLAVVGASAPLLWRRRRAFAHWSAGALLGALPLAVHALLGGHALWSDLLLRAGTNTSVPLSAADNDALVMFAALLAGLAYLAWRAARTRARTALSHLLLALALMPQALQRFDLGHVLYVGCVVIPLAVALAASDAKVPQRLAARLGRRTLRLSAALTAGTLLASLATIGAISLVTDNGLQISHAGRSMPVTSPNERVALKAVLASVSRHAPDGSVMFAGSTDMAVATINDMRLYHLLPQMKANAYNLEMPAPGTADDTLAADVRSADILVLVTVPDTWGETIFPNVERGGGRVNRVVERDFCVVDEPFAYMVYRRCGS